MKKLIVSLSVLGILFSANAVFAEMFDNLTDLSPVQKQQLNQAYFAFKQQNNAIETKIMDYTNKLNQLKVTKDKSRDELAVLSGAYERNLSTLKAQQETLKRNTDNIYKSVMTASQYQQFKNQQAETENAFNKFLMK